MRTRSPRQKQQKKVADRSLEPVRSKVEHTLPCRNLELPDRHKSIYSLVHIAFVTLLINYSNHSLDKMGNVSTTAGSMHHLDTEILINVLHSLSGRFIIHASTGSQSTTETRACRQGRTQGSFIPKQVQRRKSTALRRKSSTYNKLTLFFSCVVQAAQSTQCKRCFQTFQVTSGEAK